jgi:hypothetical protein
MNARTRILLLAICMSFVLGGVLLANGHQLALALASNSTNNSESAVTTTATTTSQQTNFDKANFHNPLKIDNKYFPLKPGVTFIYQGTQDGDPTRDEFVVTNQTKMVDGVNTRVIHDTLYVKGKVSEFTDDWFAQDDQGNVWYFGEFTTDVSQNNSHEGSWEAGMNGAKAGIIMEAQPKVGDTYNQEIARGVAEDKATVLSLDESICVPYGCFSHVLETKEFTPLEPGVVDHKFYAAGVGDIKESTVKGGSEESALVQIKTTH